MDDLERMTADTIPARIVLGGTSAARQPRAVVAFRMPNETARPPLSWQVGDVRITRILEFQVPVPWSPDRPYIDGASPEALRGLAWLVPDHATEQGDLWMAVHGLLIQAPEMSILVDTCVGNDKPRKMVFNRALHGPFLERLSNTGCPREAVDRVVCTHLHVDHVGWNTMLDGEAWVPTFPNARYLIARAEYEAWDMAADPEYPAIMEDSIRPIFDAGLVDLVELDEAICPGVRLRPTTGHTRGHVSIESESRGARALINGDFIHHPCQIAEPTWATAFDDDRAAAHATRVQILEELAGTDTLLIGTHFASPTAGYVQRQPQGLRLVSSD